MATRGRTLQHVCTYAYDEKSTCSMSAAKLVWPNLYPLSQRPEDGEHSRGQAHCTPESLEAFFGSMPDNLRGPFFEPAGRSILSDINTHGQEAVETARQVFKYAQDDVLSLSCVAEDGERAQIYPTAWECLVPIMKVVYVDKEEIGEDGETVVPKPNQSPKIECKPCVSEPEPPSSETEEEVGGIEEIGSTAAEDEEELPPPSPSPSPIQDPDEQISRH